jgi:hypothetical protein
MIDILFVGGPMDGERIGFPMDRPPPYALKVPSIQTDSPLETVTYTLKRVAWQGFVIPVFVFPGMLNVTLPDRL